VLVATYGAVAWLLVRAVRPAAQEEQVSPGIPAPIAEADHG